MEKKGIDIIYHYILIIMSIIGLMIFFIPYVDTYFNTLNFSFGVYIRDGQLYPFTWEIFFIQTLPAFILLLGTAILIYTSVKFRALDSELIARYSMLGGILMVSVLLYSCIMPPYDFEYIIRYIFIIYFLSYSFPLLIGIAIQKKKEAEIFFRWIFSIISFIGLTFFLFNFIGGAFFTNSNLKFYVYILPSIFVMFGSLGLIITAIIVKKADSLKIARISAGSGLLMVIGLIMYMITANMFIPLSIITVRDYVVLINFCIPILLGLYFLNQ